MVSISRFVSVGALVGLALLSLACGGGGSTRLRADAGDPAPSDAAPGDDDARVDAGASDAGTSDGGADDAGADDAGPGDATSDASTCDLGCATGSYDIDNNPLTGTCGCEYACSFVTADDAYDVAFTDANCDGGDGIVDACVYVSLSLGLDTQPGTRAAPMQSISAALQQAQANSVPFVCLSGEVYTETYTLPSGVGLVGSFDHQDADFAFRRKSGITTTVNGSTLP